MLITISRVFPLDDLQELFSRTSAAPSRPMRTQKHNHLRRYTLDVGNTMRLSLLAHLRISDREARWAYTKQARLISGIHP